MIVACLPVVASVISTARAIARGCAVRGVAVVSKTRDRGGWGGRTGLESWSPRLGAPGRSA
ncbi:MAG: hypothetical protein ACRDYA_18655, partial [Egibacteraceae bacterium]